MLLYYYYVTKYVKSVDRNKIIIARHVGISAKRFAWNDCPVRRSDQPEKNENYKTKINNYYILCFLLLFCYLLLWYLNRSTIAVRKTK